MSGYLGAYCHRSITEGQYQEMKAASARACKDKREGAAADRASRKETDAVLNARYAVEVRELL